MKKFLVGLLALVVSLVSSHRALAWEKRGHEIVASVAARLLEEKEHREYLKEHEFDLGYYTNVPDIIWRNINKETGAMEGPQHYIDWNDLFIKAFGTPKNLPVSFEEFKTKMGADYKFKLGVVPYRIHDLIARCKKLTENFNRESQGPLLVCLGEVSHYTGDLGMPLHTTDNHDGAMTHQEGIHGYFEGRLVDALDPELKGEVLDKARSMYALHPTKKMNSDEAVRWLIDQSHGQIDALLKIDKGLDRKNINLAKSKYKSMIVTQLAQGAILTAHVWNEILGDIHQFDNVKFYFFDGKPEYVTPTATTEDKP